MIAIEFLLLYRYEYFVSHNDKEVNRKVPKNLKKSSFLAL